jgi:transcriptional regulator GlxA family with amidase domain
MKDLDFEIGCETKGQSEFPSGNGERIRRSIDYMAEHLDQPLQVSDLAAVANLCLSHYFALFKRATGSSPIDFFIRLRMIRARQLLETSSLNIKQIAGELGYSDPFYFSRTFKSINGVAPTDYRKARQPVVQLGGMRPTPESFRKRDCNTAASDRIIHGKQSIFHSAPNTF